MGLVVVCLSSPACSSKPDGVDVKPITSLQFIAGPDFLAKIQRHYDGKTYDQSWHGAGVLVIPLPSPDPDNRIFRSLNVYREASLLKAQATYAEQKVDFTHSDDWNLYVEQGTAAERSFISYKGTRLDTNHGIPIAVDTKPEIFIAVLKQNVVITISYTAYVSRSDYIQTINNDVRFVADLLSKAAS